MKRGRSLADYIGADDIIVVQGTRKNELFSELAEAANAGMTNGSAEDISDRLWEREHLLSTRLGTHVAMPHAQLPEARETVVILALCPEGVQYDAHTDEPVHLVFCIIGPEADHLETLSTVAAALQLPVQLNGLVQAARDADIDRVLSMIKTDSAEEIAPGDSLTARRDARSRQIWLQAVRLAPVAGSHCILLHLRSGEAANYSVPPDSSSELSVLLPEDLGMPPSAIAGTGGTPGSGLSIALLYALTEQRIQSSDIIINVYGSREPTALDTIQVIDVETAFPFFFSVSRDVAMDAAPHRTMLRVVELAAEIAAEGREGKPVGALFVLGDAETVRAHCQQMLMNPFKGYEPRQRNILDPVLSETVKELSRIDGAFIITDEGVIESAGTYLRVDVELAELPPGLGARHAAAASITAVSHAVAVVISESTRQVSIFRHGRRVVVL